MKKTYTKWTRLKASLLALVMIISSLQFNLFVYSEEESAPVGIGVINNVYSEDADRNTYKVEFYKNGEAEPVTIPGFNLDGKTIDAQGYFEIKHGAYIDLISYDVIKDFINTNNITQVKITFIENGSSNPKKYHFYSASAPENSNAAVSGDSVTYTIIKERVKKDSSGNPMFEDIVDEVTGEVTGTKPIIEKVKLTSADYKLSSFTSSEIKEYDVNVNWRDTGTMGRPQLAFDIYRTTDTTITDSTNFESVSDPVVPAGYPVNDTSNHTTYAYEVPKYNDSGTEYNYEAALSDSVNLTPASGKEYRIEPDSGKADEFTLYGKKSFDFNIKWLSGKTSTTLDDEAIKNYVYDNYNFYDGTETTPLHLTIDKSKITWTRNETTGVVTVHINGLDEITDDGRAKVFYLQKKTDTNIPISNSTDSWKVSIENTGVNSSETQKILQNATISNVISGTVDFNTTVTWNDSGEKKTTRQGLTDASTVVLWRYADRYNTEKDNLLRTAQIASQTVTGVNDSTNVSFTGLEKYDRYGYEYKYYADEQFSSALEGYQASYQGGGDHVVTNQTITNVLSGTRVFTVEAEWKAAARQGGNASVTYQVQKKVGEEWVSVEVPDIDEYGNMLNEQGEIVTTESEANKKGKLIIKNFQAETMSKSAKFAALPEYENGQKIDYRVVQIDVTRDDNKPNSTDPSYSQTVDSTLQNTITLNGDDYSIKVDKDYQGKKDTYKFTYQLTGTIPLIIEKEWNDQAYYINQHTGDLSHESHTINALVEKMDFGANEFQPYLSDDTDNNGIVAITAANSEVNPNVTVANTSPYTLIWKKTINVPIYDDDGHEFQYRVNEKKPPSNYTVWVTYDKPTNTYKISNTYSLSGGPALDFSKEWQDDGDLLHRADVVINYSDKVGRSDPGSTYDPNNEQGKNGSATVKESQSWKARIGVRSNYIYNSNDFTEGSSGDYTYLNRIYCDTSFTTSATISGLTAGEIYKVLKQSGDTWTEILSERAVTEGGTLTVDNITEKCSLKVQHKVVTGEGESTTESWQDVTTGISVTLSNTTATSSIDNGIITISYPGVLNRTAYSGEDYNGKAWINPILSSLYSSTNVTDPESLAGTDINFVSFDNLVGLYKNGEHYYAVEQIPNSKTSARPSDILFRNTRVGVVSFKVNIDWKVGDWNTQNPTKNVKVKITPKINGKKIKADGTPIADDDTTTQPLTITKEIPVSKNEFYLTNLPKYDKTGKIIEWELEEIAIAGENIATASSETSPTGTESYCTIDGKKCVVTVSNTVYTYNNDHHTDDLITVSLTNQFQDEKEATVNKVWYDDNNALSMRSDTYMHLYRKSKKPGSLIEPYGNKYTFKANNENSWSYTFTKLPQFDDEGYEYDYYIQEMVIDDYTTSQLENNTEIDLITENTTEEGVVSRLVPDGGTFVDRISGQVEIKGSKLWQNILEDFDHKHYPIAEIYLYRRNKYKLNSNNEKVVTTDADNYTNKIGTTKIYQGDDEYAFKANFVKDTNGNITDWNPEIISGYYLLDDTVKVNGQKAPLVGNNDALILPKYDADGALITYKLQEESINGYAFKISEEQETVINEYNGGSPVEIAVTKSWENMSADSQYPAVKLVLHQIMMAKTTDENGNILQTDDNYQPSTYSPQKPKLTCVEYNTYEIVLTKDLVDHPTDDIKDSLVKNSDSSWTYTFGKIKTHNDDYTNVTRYNPKENLRQLAPDGSYFAYYVTEQLINFEDTAVELNALDNGNNTSTFLGDFYLRETVQNAINTNDPNGNLYSKYNSIPIKDSAYGFKIKTYIQPERIDNEPDTNHLITKTAEIKNSYEPELSNYQGKLVVEKQWDNKDASDQNSLNSEFTKKGYKVTVSRMTSNIDEESIFQISTGDKDTDAPTVSVVDSASTNDYQITLGTMTPNQSDGKTDYYVETIQFKKTSYTGFTETIPVTFRIYKRRPTDNDYATMHNKIEISGLAIYAQDATKYTYYITEDTAELSDPMKAYVTNYKIGNSWIKSRVGQKMEKEDNVYTANFGLKNELKVFTLTLYKVFGKEYTPQGSNTKTTTILEPRDYNLYFNNDFVKALRFELWRKEGQSGTFKRYNYMDTSITANVENDGSDKQYSVNINGQTYSLKFKNLPKYSPNGNVYYYQVREKYRPDRAHYTILYTNNRSQEGDSSYKEVTCDDNTSDKETSVRNVFEAKQILIKKYWEDDSNADGMRPVNLKTTVTEFIPQYTSGETTIAAHDETSIRILKNNDSDDTQSWQQKVEFPQFYYNGTIPIPGLKYRIDETTVHSSGGDGAYAYNLEEKGYKTPVYGYKLQGATLPRTFDSRTPSVAIDGSSNNDLVELNVTNSKDRVNSKLTFDKVWDDSNNKWGLRPSVMYVKLLRNTKGVINVTSTKNILIPGSNADSSHQITAEIRNLDKETDYRIVRRIMVGTNEVWDQVTTIDSTFDYQTYSNADPPVPTTTEIKTITFTLNDANSAVTEMLQLQKKNSNGEWETIDTDRDGQKIRAILSSDSSSSGSSGSEVVKTNNAGQPAGIKDSTTFSSSGGEITIPAGAAVDGKVSVLIEGLLKDDNGSVYSYYVSGTDTPLPTRVDSNGTVSVIATVGEGTTSLKLQRSANGAGMTDVTDSFTATRYFAADSTTGVVAIPVNSSGIIDNPGVTFENLDYGYSTGSDTINGTWKPYYYTTLECDKAGYDVNSKLTSSQTDTDTGTPAITSVDLSFDIDVSSYINQRKHINIKVTRNGESTPIATDINNKPLRITINGSDYYASNSDHNTPTLGVIVIPVTPSGNETEIHCTVHDLPYAPGATYNDTNKYTYNVSRCNSSGNGSYDNYVGTITPSTKQVPSTTTVSYTKAWNEYAVNSGLKPNYIHLKLFRAYIDENDAEKTEEVTGHDELNNIDVTGASEDPDEPGVYKFSGTISGLEAGKVVTKSDGVGIWRKYTYFLKEYYDSACSNESERPGSTTYAQFTQTKGEDKPFVLEANSNSLSATLSEGAKNTITTTKHDVVKKWIDNDDDNPDQGSTNPPSRADYYVVLQRRAGVEGAWENVDLSKTSVEQVSDNGTASAYDGVIKTVGSAPNTYTVLTVDKNKLHIRFDKLSYCAENGAPYQYRAAEVKIGEQGIQETKTYLFLVPGTKPTDDEYSYVRVVHRGSNNYNVTYNYDADYVDPDDPNASTTNYAAVDYDYSKYATEPTRIVNKIVNPITFSHIEVNKKWSDEDNVYGMRPEKITFRLTRTKNGKLDNDFKSNKTVGEADNWSCKWEQLAAFAADGSRFEYFVSELPVAGYTTSAPVSTSETDSSGETTWKLTFENTYVPQKKTLTAEKLWEDFSNKYGLRPTDVTYELYCKYDIYNTNGQKQANGYFGPVYNSTAQSEVYNEILKAKKIADGNENATVPESDFKKTVTGATDAQKWTTTFTNLPAWINPTGTAIVNGNAVEVTYYIVESFGNNDEKYKKIYKCEASNMLSADDEQKTAGTSEDSWVLEKGLVYTGSAATNNVYTIPSTVSVNGKQRVLIRDLPIADASGNKYMYEVTETDSSGNTISGTHNVSIYSDSNNANVKSPFVESAGLVTSKEKQETTDLMITADSDSTPGDVYFKITCKKTVVTEGYADDLTGCTFAPVYEKFKQNTESKVLAYELDHQAGDVVMHIYDLPKADNNNILYTYSVTEYGSDQTDEAVPLDSTNITVTSAQNTTNFDKVDLTIIKPGTTKDQKFYYRIKYRTSVTTPENSILNEKTAQPLLICGADENPVYKNSKTEDNSPKLVDEISSANIDVTESNPSDYQKNVMIENDIICLFSDTTSAELTIKGLPKYNSYGFKYDYTPVEYSGYSPGATENDSTTMYVDVQTDSNDTSKVNVKVSKTLANADDKVCFRLKRSIKYSQADSLGDFTVLKSAASSGATASIQNTLNTRNIIVALDWNDNDYQKGVKIKNDDPDHPGEDAVLAKHYNTEIKLKCDSLNVNSSSYEETKTIAVTSKTEISTKRPYTVKYGVVFNDLPKYNSSGTAYEFDIEQKIKTGDLSEADYKAQIVNAYNDTTGKSLLTKNDRKLGQNIAESKSGAETRLEVKDGNDNKQGRKYSYAATYTSYTDTADADYVTQYNILNTLPLTAVYVVKHWDDDSNKFGLRPVAPTGSAADPLGLVLETKLSTDSTWKDPEYMLSQKAAERITVKDADNTWTYIYKKLLKSDAENNLYQFKVTEKPGGNITNVKGYIMPNYDATAGDSNAKQTIESDDALKANSNKAWDGTNPLTATMDITNKLDTRDIIVTKDWNDNGYGGDNKAIASKLHYKTAVTLEGTGLKWTVDDHNKPHSETKYLTTDDMTDGKGVIFRNLPKYNANGEVIVYKVTEKLDSDNNHSTAAADKAVPGSGDWTNYCDTEPDQNDNTKTIDKKHSATVNTEFVQETGDSERQYGYNGSAEKYLKTDTVNSTTKDIVNRYHITDTLPLTAVKVNKQWEDDSNKFSLRPTKVRDVNKYGGDNISDEIALTLLKKISTDKNYSDLVSADITITQDNNYRDWYITTTLDTTTVTDTWSFEYQKLLKYDVSNKEYTFQIEEADVNGYKKPTYTRTDPDDSTNTNGQIVDAVTVSSYTGTDDKWDGTHILKEEFYIQNELDTRDIIVTKSWADNNYSGGSGLHYKLAITLENTGISYEETKYLAANETEGVVFQKLPIFDKNGQVIVYKVKEAYDNDNSHEVASGNDLHSALTGTLTAATPTEFTAPTDTERRYGYEGTCKKIEAGETGKKYVKQYSITNTLPVATFNVDVFWNDQMNRDGKRLESVKTVLKRDAYVPRPEITESPSGKTAYTTDGRKIYFSTSWTELKVLFKDSSDNNIPDSSEYSVTTADGKNYIAVPTTAKKFVLKGKKESADVQSVITDLTPGSTYTVTDDKVGEAYKLTSNGAYESKYISEERSSIESGAMNDGSENKNKKSWYYNFGNHPVFSGKNVPYTYSISEKSDTTSGLTTNYYTYDYSRSITMSDTPVIHETKDAEYKDYESSFETDEVIKTTTASVTKSTITSVNFEVRNNYTPETGKIKITKTWAGDVNYKATTRPLSITYKLYCNNADSQKVLVTDSSVSSWFSGYTIPENATITVNGDNTTDSWDKTVIGLPVNKNPSGTETTPGNSDTITYILEEITHKAYNVDSNNKSVILSPNATHGVEVESSIAFTNTLKTRDITVTKTWDDGDYSGTSPTIAELHYNIDVTLACDELKDTEHHREGDTGEKYYEKKTLTVADFTNNSGSGKTFTGLPMYDKNAAVLNYTVNEKAVDTETSANSYGTLIADGSPSWFTVTNHKYGYVGNCTAKKAQSGEPDVVTSYDITNILSLTSVTVNKNWVDTDLNDGNDTHDHDFSGFRPNEIKLDISRSTDNPSTNNNPTWTKILDDDSVTAEKVNSSNSNQWVSTYDNLLRYSENNSLFHFMVEEKEVPAYSTQYNTQTSLTDADSHTLDITNTLKTKDVKLKKTWDDVTYPKAATDGLHFDIYYTLTSKNNTNLPNGEALVFHAIQLKKTGNDAQTVDSSGHYITDGGTKIIHNVPVYDKTGTKIEYDAVESTQSDYSAVKDLPYGYKQTNKSTYYSSGDYPGTLEQIEFINTLPLTTVQVQKNWVFTSGYSRYAKSGSDTVNVTLSRKSGTGDYSQVDSSSSLSHDNPFKFENLLVYDENHNQYNYKVEETTVPGYTTSYSVNGIELDNVNANDGQEESPSETILITNTEKKGQASFIKIDGTHKRLYYNKTGYTYTDRTLSGAQFELYLQAGDSPASTDTKCNVTESSTGHYVFTTNTGEGTTTILTSGNDGEIVITGLPLNKYYLKETNAPNGFKFDSFYADTTFSLDVDESNSVQSASGKIENEQIANSIELTKRDAADNSVITASKATYKLLKMIPQDTNTGHTTELNYETNARNAIGTTNQSVYWEDNWTQAGPHQTDGSGKIEVTGLEHGTYFFYEIQAPVGYEIDNSATDSKFFTIAPGTHGAKLTADYTDPRKEANVKVLKTDEYGNGLSDAVFELWYRPPGYAADTVPEKPAETEPASITPRTDHGYIYFTDVNYNNEGVWVQGTVNENTGRFVKQNDSNTAKDWIVAEFSKSSDSSAKEIRYLDQRYVNEYKQVVYKVEPPSAEYNRVTFYQLYQRRSNESDPWGETKGKHTVQVDVSVGQGYYINNNIGDDYTLGTWMLETNDGPPSSSAVPYVSSEHKLVVTLDSDLIQTDQARDWDDLHVMFFDENYDTIGQSAPGYILDWFTSSINDGKARFQIMIPKGAAYFQLNNGTKIDGCINKYQTAITPISHTDDNYYKFVDPNTSDHLNFQLVKWDDIPVITRGEDQILSDKDYIYFTDNQSWSGTIYAYYFGDTGYYQAWPGIESDGTYVNEYGQTVYRFRYPSGSLYNNVIFTNNFGSQTVDILYYSAGIDYYPTGENDDSGHAKVEKTTICTSKTSYTPVSNVYDKYIYIIDSNATKWTDVHVDFKNQDGNSIQTNHGYVPYYMDDTTDGKWYKILLPSNAKSFSVNNGNNNSSGDNIYKSTTENSDVVAGGIYKFDNTQTNASLYDLVKQPPNRTPGETADLKIATVVTGYDGMNKSVTLEDNVSEYAEVDSENKSILLLKKWGSYYFKEITPPEGYDAHVFADHADVFKISAEQADLPVYIAPKVVNTRKKGSVVLTKTSKEQTVTKNIGRTLPNATFNLFRVNDDNSPTKLSVAYASGVYTPDSGSTYDLVTNADGKIIIEGLDWGRYYLVETNPPSGYVKTEKINNSEQDNKVYFSVGSNNCETVQHLSCADNIQKATITISKTVYELHPEWGDPTFIFKVRQTKFKNTYGEYVNIDEASQPERTISITFDASNQSKKTDSVSLDVEPGTYEVREINVSRYALDTDGCTWKVNSGTSESSNDKATFNIDAGDTAAVGFSNHVEYYDKFSHVSKATNHFGGYKGIRVRYDSNVPINSSSAVINKKDLTYYKINSDGSETKVTEDADKNALTISYVRQTGDDPNFGNNTPHDFSVTDDKIIITNPSRYADGVYRLKAQNTDNFVCEFDIRFMPSNSVTKAYEKTIVFKADDENKSYFDDSGVKTSQYAFTFTMVADGSDYKVYSVQHNGEVIAQGTDDEIKTSMNNALTALTSGSSHKLTVNEVYRSTWKFKEWTKVGGTTTTINYDALKRLATDGTSTTVNYEAVLEPIPSP